MATVRKHTPIVDDSITLRSGHKLAYCVHGVDDGIPVIFFCGAGFGRTYVPTPFPSLLETQNVRFITVDRPGYGDSTLREKGRTYRDWVGDVGELMDHLGLDKARFLAHSAGTPHLAAVCAFAPERVVAASLVCPVSPIVGDPPIDRPTENFSRGCGRLMTIHLGSFLDKLFGYVVSFRYWLQYKAVVGNVLHSAGLTRNCISHRCSFLPHPNSLKNGRETQNNTCGIP